MRSFSVLIGGQCIHCPPIARLQKETTMDFPNPGTNPELDDIMQRAILVICCLS